MTHRLKALNRRGSPPVSNEREEVEWLVLHSRPTPFARATSDAIAVFSVVAGATAHRHRFCSMLPALRGGGPAFAAEPSPSRENPWP